MTVLPLFSVLCSLILTSPFLSYPIPSFPLLSLLNESLSSFCSVVADAYRYINNLVVQFELLRPCFEENCSSTEYKYVSSEFINTSHRFRKLPMHCSCVYFVQLWCVPGDLEFVWVNTNIDHNRLQLSL